MSVAFSEALLLFTWSLIMYQEHLHLNIIEHFLSFIQPSNSGIGLSGKPKSHYSLWNVLPRGGAWNRAIWPIAEMLANALTANRGEC